VSFSGAFQIIPSGRLCRMISLPKHPICYRYAKFLKKKKKSRDICNLIKLVDAKQDIDKSKYKQVFLFFKKKNAISKSINIKT
jgi:hypothetical protein